MILDARKPENSWAVHNPREIIKNREPAWEWEMPKSFSMVGISGANIKRPKKERKNKLPITIKYRILALNGSGTGQSLIAG